MHMRNQRVKIAKKIRQNTNIVLNSFTFFPSSKDSVTTQKRGQCIFLTPGKVDVLQDSILPVQNRLLHTFPPQTAPSKG